MTNFQTAQQIMFTILSRVMECTLSAWPQDFKWGKYTNLVDEVKSMLNYVPINPSKFTVEELTQLGFKTYSEHTPLYLIPLWLYPFLGSDVEIYTTDMKRVTDKSSLDLDIRGGCIHYGVLPVTIPYGLSKSDKGWCVRTELICGTKMHYLGNPKRLGICFAQRRNDEYIDVGVRAYYEADSVGMVILLKLPDPTVQKFNWCNEWVNQVNMWLAKETK